MTMKEYDYCLDCKHFRQHYVNIKNVGLRKTNCGHCCEHNIKYGCEHFEKRDEINQNLYENEVELANLLISTKNHLKDFLYHLEKLELLFKNDK